MSVLIYVVAVPIVVALQLCVVIVAFIMIGAGLRYLTERRAGVAKAVARERFRAAWTGVWAGDLRNVESRYMLPVLGVSLLCLLLLDETLVAKLVPALAWLLDVARYGIAYTIVVCAVYRLTSMAI
jgi:hypothetical protein